MGYKLVKPQLGIGSLVLDDMNVVMCDIDGILVLDTKLHDAWHESTKDED